MSLVLTKALPGVADRSVIADRLRAGCSLASLIAASIHITVGVEHAGTNFGALSLTAGLAQLVLGVILLARASGWPWSAIVVLDLMLVEAYALNVVTGLPPAIAHAHIGGTHQVWGLTLALPGVVEVTGLVTVAVELATIAACAMRARISTPARRR